MSTNQPTEIARKFVHHKCEKAICYYYFIRADTRHSIKRIFRVSDTTLRKIAAQFSDDYRNMILRTCWKSRPSISKYEKYKTYFREFPGQPDRIVSKDAAVFVLRGHRWEPQKCHLHHTGHITFDAVPVSRIMALIWHGEPDGEMRDYDAHHIDGNCRNNNYKNVEWILRSVHKRMPHARGDARKPTRRLTDNDVLSIFDDYWTRGVSQVRLARQFDTSQQYVHQIVNMKARKSLLTRHQMAG